MILSAPQHFGGLDREQAHGTRAPDSHDFSALDALGSLIARGENVGEEEHLLVRHSVRHFHGRDIGHRHTDIFGLAASVTASQM